MRDVSHIPSSEAPQRFDDKVYFQALQALTEDDKPRFPRWKWFALACAISLVVAILVIGLRQRMVERIAPPSLTLTVAPAGPDILITWGGGPPRSSVSQLHVRDDGHVEDIDLLPGYGLAGTFVYHPKTRHVHVTWGVKAGGQSFGREADYEARADGAEPAGAELAPVAKPHDSVASKVELEHLRAHDRRMEALVKALRAKQGEKPK